MKKWEGKLSLYKKMYEYYKGKTDIDSSYQMQTDRSNLKVKVNFMKKFIKEEVSYSLGNDITYISKQGNKEVTDFIDLAFEELNEQHDIELAKTMLIFNKAYEVFYLEGDIFKSKVITPLEGFEVKDNKGIVQAFVRVFEVEEGEEKVKYIDVYTPDSIEHYKGEFESLGSTTHYFGFIPYGKCEVGEEGEFDTIYNDIKGLQDAYENNLSDLVNEISDFRNAYLILTGTDIDEPQAAEMKKLGIMELPEGGKAEWLIKSLNDTFIQNTLATLEDKMYQLTQHINHNEKMQSNLSGVALRSRLISLEEKCKLNQRALTECIKKRLKALFTYYNKLEGKTFDWRDIKIKFTPNIPQDDVATADLISKVGDKLSLETALSLFSFIENPQKEAEKVKTQQEEMFQADLKGVDVVE